MIHRSDPPLPPHFLASLAAVLICITLVITGIGLWYISGVRKLQGQATVVLPSKPAPKATPDPSQLRIEVGPAGDLSIEGQALTMEELKAKLAGSHQSRVLLRTSKKARYEMLKGILEELGAAGVEDVTFSVVDKGE